MSHVNFLGDGYRSPYGRSRSPAQPSPCYLDDAMLREQLLYFYKLFYLLHSHGDKLLCFYCEQLFYILHSHVIHIASSV